MKKVFVILYSLSLSCLGHSQIIDTLIDVGGYKLHFNIVRGKGVPILFEAGNGSDASVWKDLLKPIHDSTNATLITYDRAGLGLSEIDTNKVGLLNEVRVLEIALQKLGFTKKIFFVNHSFGSYYSILFAIRNQQKVSGAVFIDPALPCNYTKKRNKEGNESITPELWERIKKEARGLYYILKNYEQICDLMETKKFPSHIQATVIGSEIQSFLKTESYKQEWKECIKSFGSFANRTYVLAKNSGHTVWKDNPTLVANEIITLYKQTSKNKYQ